ncbi:MULTISPECIES: hypothetical protein [Prochlorococcus]|uniref:hypothetical protein n=1 Tax=Prochlorococcus TaxID=1218 RepID=UPI000533AA71|nr:MULTISPECIES: hypothetical protein [Prochlorococcus]KGG14133.1 hypothetical protein EV05_0022 [Prochlorococcus sp. MIT 0601]
MALSPFDFLKTINLFKKKVKNIYSNIAASTKSDKAMTSWETHKKKVLERQLKTEEAKKAWEQEKFKLESKASEEPNEKRENIIIDQFQLEDGPPKEKSNINREGFSIEEQSLFDEN